jgi:hypothetical protein
MRSPLLVVMALAAAALPPGPLLPSAVDALPLSVGISNQIQVGWQASERNAIRQIRQRELGTLGEHILPLDGSRTIALYGTPFIADPGQESFDYGSTNRDITTVSTSRTTSFSVLGTYSGTGQATSPEPLGYFANGNSVFQQSNSSSR